MKYKEYIKQLEQLPHKDNNGKSLAEMYADAVEIWSNYACIGYCKIAMQQAGVDDATAGKILAELNRAFDDFSIDEAENRR